MIGDSSSDIAQTLKSEIWAQGGQFCNKLQNWPSKRRMWAGFCYGFLKRDKSSLYMLM